ncbi:hypothetical protein ABZ584_24450 [Streptomyces antibioticus]|uniref:hypothetical protein n=1 Tax=Streptomyces antibioticus TaxID=1890 RepID=UPI0033DA03AC
MNVDDVIAAKIAAAKWRAAQEKKRRAELAEARRAGLARRHAEKLRRLAQLGLDLAPPTNPDNQSCAASGA